MRRIIPFIIAGLLLAGSISAQPSFPVNGELFVDTVVPRVDITINPDSLQWIYNNPESDREFHALFVFDNGTVRDTIDPVGFRLRGNTSRWSRKKSFKVSFNTFTPGGKYYGVEKMNLNGEHNDPSVIRSKVMWDILRKWDIPAPRANHVRVYINGLYYGLYINVEHIDEEFALSRFGNNDGNLYKCLYPADLAYLGSNPDSYKIWTGDRWVYELKTNEEENDFSDLAAFIGVLEHVSDESLVCNLNALFNTYDYLKIMAAQIFCGDWDGYIYNKNNFYLYHNTETGKFEYIPYDVDNTFGIDWFNVDWALRDIYEWQPGGDQVRPLYDRFMHNTVFREQYSWYAGQLINSTLDIDSLIQSVEARKAMIAPYVADDPFYPLDYGYDFDDFQRSYTEATGAHVKYGLFPYMQTRLLSMTEQIETGSMDPVIKYIRHQRIAGQPITISAFVEADAMPVVFTVLYSVNGGTAPETVMAGDGSGTYTATLENIPDDALVNYQLRAEDGSGRTTILPCLPARISPVAGNTPLLFINEFMADNEATIADDHGSYSDWIEIYNGDVSDVWLGSLYLTDNFSVPDKWRLPSVTLPAGGFTLIWADGNSALGATHASFKLDKDGEEIGIYTSDLLVVDTLTFGGQDEDVSTGRQSDGAAEIVTFTTPTPGHSNTVSYADQVPAEESLKLWPNPSGGAIIRLNRAVDCRIYNMAGILVYAGHDVTEIDVSKYPAGVYIIITGEGQVLKLVKSP